MPHNRGVVKIMVYIFSSAAKMKGELSTGFHQTKKYREHLACIRTLNTAEDKGIVKDEI